METAIGVFSSRERAEEAVRELLESRVPEEAIVFLTRSESEAAASGKQAGATVGGFMGVATGMSAGVAVATLMAHRHRNGICLRLWRSCAAGASRRWNRRSCG
jgi:hypothetical protein